MLIRTAVIDTTSARVINIVEFEDVIPEEHLEDQSWVASPDAQIGDTWDGAQFIKAASPPAFQYDWRTAIWTSFRTKRDVYLSRLADIAGRCQRKGGIFAVVPTAADAIAEAILELPAHPSVQPDATPTPELLEKAITNRANDVLRSQLYVPGTYGVPNVAQVLLPDAATIKAALDKVFK